MNELIQSEGLGKATADDLFARVRQGLGILTASTYFIGDACLELSKRGYGAKAIARQVGCDERLVNVAILISRRIAVKDRRVEMPVNIALTIARNTSERYVGAMVDWWEGPGERTQRTLEVQRKAREMQSMGIMRPRTQKSIGKLKLAGRKRSSKDTLYFSPPVRHACPLGSTGPTYTIKGRAAEPSFDLYVNGTWRFSGSERECEGVAREDFDVLLARAPGLADLTPGQVYQNYLAGCKGAAQLALEKCRLVATLRLGRLFSALGVTLDAEAVSWILEDPSQEWEAAWSDAIAEELK